MSENVKKEQPEKKEKMPKPFEKFIWLGVSVIIALVGYFCRTGDVIFPWWGCALYAALLLFTIIIAAQKMNIERFSFAEKKEDKTKFILASVAYYVFIFIAVFYVFYGLWVARILSI